MAGRQCCHTWPTTPDPEVSKIVIGTHRSNRATIRRPSPIFPKSLKTSPLSIPTMTHLHLWQIDNLNVAARFARYIAVPGCSGLP